MGITFLPDRSIWFVGARPYPADRTPAVIAMARIILFIVAATLGSPVLAQTYGTLAGGCDRAAGTASGEDAVYFDGQIIAGEGWTCTLLPAAGETYIGQCEREGSAGRMPASFTVTQDGEAISISSDADKRIFVMRPCG